MPDSFEDLTAHYDFWRRLSGGVEVAVASQIPAHLLGVRDGVLRFCRQHIGARVPVAVVEQAVPLQAHGLPATDQEALERLDGLLTRLAGEVGDDYHFTVAAEGSLHTVAVAGQPRRFVRCWAAVRGLPGGAFGGSGAIEVPWDDGRPGEAELAPGALGTRRGGGLTETITGGAENRRKATADATFYAFSSLYAGSPGRP